MEPLREQDIEALADIIWWIHGYQSALGGSETCHLSGHHIEALRRARMMGQAALDRGNRVEAAPHCVEVGF